MNHAPSGGQPGGACAICQTEGGAARLCGHRAMSDPCNPFEEELQLTRHALELIDAYSCGVAAATLGYGDGQLTFFD